MGSEFTPHILLGIKISFFDISFNDLFNNFIFIDGSICGVEDE